MTSFFKLLQWVLKAAVFFTLFAFALNNQHEASVHFFFGTQWRSPMVLVVLAAFALVIQREGKQGEENSALQYPLKQLEK